MFNPIRSCLGCLTTLLLVIVLLGVGVFLLSVRFFEAVVENYVEWKSGFETVVRETGAQWSEGELTFGDVTIENPPAFQGDDMVRFNRLRADLDLFASAGLLRGDPLVFDEVDVDLAYLSVIRDGEGRTNLEAFAENWRTKGNGTASGSEPGSGSAPGDPSWRIRELLIRIDTVRVADRSRIPAVSRELEVNIEVRMRDVDDWRPVLEQLEREMRRAGAGEVFEAFLFSLLNLENYRDFAEKVLRGSGRWLDGAGDQLQKWIESPPEP